MTRSLPVRGLASRGGGTAVPALRLAGPQVLRAIAAWPATFPIPGSALLERRVRNVFQSEVSAAVDWVKGLSAAIRRSWSHGVADDADSRAVSRVLTAGGILYVHVEAMSMTTVARP